MILIALLNSTEVNKLMDLDLILLWLATLLPIVISPGPANILYAASGSAFGVKGTLPFWLGANFTSIFQTLTVGFCFDWLLSLAPQVLEIVKYGGVGFLLYLALKFFRMSCAMGSAPTPLTFKDGVIVELLNAKYLMVPTIMFSQFYTPGPGGAGRIVGLTLALLCLTLSANMVWIVGGNSLTAFVASESRQRLQGLVFGSLLSLTALWLCFQ